MCSVVSDFPTPRTVAHQAPLSMGFSRQEYWSRFAISSSRGSSRPRMELMSPALQADSLPLSHQESIQSYLQGPLKARPLVVEPMLLARFSLSLLPVTHCSGPLNLMVTSNYQPTNQESTQRKIQTDTEKKNKHRLVTIYFKA